MLDARMIRAMLETAGRLAMQHFLNPAPSLKADNSYVTQADLAVQAFLKTELDTHFPDDGIIAEEDNLRKNPSSGDRYWIVDPIDGTASFVAGLPTWGIALGLMEQGEPVAGFFWMPATRDFFYTLPGEAVYRNDQRLHMKARYAVHSETLLLAHSRTHQRYTLSSNYPGKIFCLGSAVAHCCYLAAGGADAVLIGHDRIWDLVAGLALLVKNGGILRYINGPAVSLPELLSGAPALHPMLGGHPDIVDQLEPMIVFPS